MEDVKDEGNAAGDANAKNDEKDDNILQDFHPLAVTVKDWRHLKCLYFQSNDHDKHFIKSYVWMRIEAKNLLL